LIATEQDAAARVAWQAEAATWDAGQLVFLDETSTHTSLTRSRGRAPRGERVVGRVPRNHGPNLSCLAALGPSGITAPLVIEGAIDGTVFQPWLRDWLLPTLPAGTMIVCDNRSVHRNPDVRTLVAAAGCHLRYLPSYSPDFNPIELAFSKLKTHLRGAGRRTREALREAIGDGLGSVTADAARAWDEHCGYRFPAADPVQPL
jgi:transposase